MLDNAHGVQQKKYPCALHAHRYSFIAMKNIPEKRVRNVRWNHETDKIARLLAAERDMDVSQLLEALVRENAGHYGSGGAGKELESPAAAATVRPSARYSAAKKTSTR